MTLQVPIDRSDDPRVSDYVGLADPELRARFEDGGTAGPSVESTFRRSEHHSPDGRFVAEGFLAVAALARSPYRMRSILVAEPRRHRLAELGPLEEDVVVYVASQSVLERTVGFGLHRGIVAVGERLPAVAPATIIAGAGGRPLLVLEALNDLENLGVVFRNAAAFGVAGVLLDPRCADPLYRRCVRVSLGHVLAIPFARTPAPQWPSVLHDVVRAGYETIALSPSGELALHACDPAHFGPVALLAGAEGPGLSPEAMPPPTRRCASPWLPRWIRSTWERPPLSRSTGSPIETTAADRKPDWRPAGLYSFGQVLAVHATPTGTRMSA